jgi:predicted GIY-YIG superfamily endonuclease
MASLILEDGNPVCRVCYAKAYIPQKECTICGSVGRIAKNKDDDKVCQKCYNKHYRERVTYSICGKPDIIQKRDGDKNICISCYSKYYQPKRPCSICGNTGRIHKIDNEKSICSSCYYIYYRPRRACSICGDITIIQKKDTGIDICRACYTKYYKPKSYCSECGTLDIVAIIDNGKKYCSKCYQKYFAKKRICSICNLEQKTACIINGESICPSCYRKFYQPRQSCSLCGKVSTISKKDGEILICKACYHKYYIPKRQCAICGNVSIVRKKIEGKNICAKCYKKNYWPKRLCSLCNKESHIIKIIDDKSICIQCYNRIEEQCDKCGIITKYFFYTEKLCANCWYKNKTQKTLAISISQFINGKIAELYEDYCNTLLEYRTALSAYMILIDHTELFYMFDRNIFMLEQTTYEEIENLIVDNQVSHGATLLNYLVKKKIIEMPNPYNKYKNYVDTLSYKLDTKLSVVLKEHSVYLLKKHNTFIERNWKKGFLLSTCYDYSYVLYLLLCFVSTKVKTINEINDNIIDEFFFKHNWAFKRLRDVIKWLNNNIDMFTKLSLPEREKKSKSIRSISGYDLNIIIESLSSPRTTYRDKTLGFLLLLYAIRPTELSTIKMSHYKTNSTQAKLFVRNTWIPIHPFISQIIDNYIELERDSALSLGSEVDWLFYGKSYNLPLTPNSISFILKTHHIKAGDGFGYAISSSLLSGNIIPATLIRGLGLSLSTVIKYYNNLNIENLYELKYTDDTSYDSDYNEVYEIQLNATSDQFYVYILLCSDNSLYTGYSGDIEKRLSDHKKGYASKYTSTRLLVKLVYIEELNDRKGAIKREKQIKNLSRYEKDKLIEKNRLNH